MMDVPVHNLEWILQKQRQKSEQKSMHSSITTCEMLFTTTLSYPSALDMSKVLLASLDLLSQSQSLSLALSVCALCNVYDPAPK